MKSRRNFNLVNIQMRFLMPLHSDTDKAHQTDGFTLVELLIVIVVLGILMALLLPAFNSVREGARQAACSNQMRQLGMGMQQYESRYGAFPAAFTGGEDGSEFEDVPNYNVLAYILPYLELDYIANIFDMESDWNDTTNRKDELSEAELAIFKQRMGFTNNNFHVTNQRIAEQDAFQFLCSSAPVRGDADISQGIKSNGDPQKFNFPHAATDYCSAYAIAKDFYNYYSDSNGHGYEGPESALGHGMLQSNKRTGASAIRDGMGNTFLLFESAGKPYRYQDGKTYVDWSLPNGDIEKINLLANDAFTQWSNWKASMKINPGAGADDDDNPYLNWNKDKFINHTNIGEVYSFHPDGAMILYGDGAVKFESEDMDPAVFINRFTRNGGEVEYRD